MARLLYEATPPTLTDKKQTEPLCDASGNLKVAISSGAGAVLVATDDAALAPGGAFMPVGGIVDDTATDTADEGDGAVIRLTSRRALLSSLDTLIAGEDQTNGVMKVEGQFTYTRCTADTQVKASAGYLKRLIFQSTDAVPTAGTIVTYDNTAESGNIVATMDIKATAPIGLDSIVVVDVEAIMATGIYIGFTTAADVAVTAIWR